MRLLRSSLVIAAIAAPSTAQLPMWQRIMPTTMPSVRRAGAMAFHPPTSKLVLYGGVAVTPALILSETWTYNGQWQQQLSVAAPGRWGHQMVLDTATNTILTFGGRSPTIGGLANDTLRYDGVSWSTIPTPSAPSPRFLYGMCYDSARQVVVLFGGRSATGTLDETWEFDGVTWTQRTPANRPAPREEMVLHYDPSLNRTVLFGGCNEATGTVYGDTWFYNGNDWLNVTPTQSPSPRFRAASVFDSVRQRLVVYGGYDNTQILQETYEFTGDQWLQISTAMAPPNATEAYAGYDAVRRKFVLFGGFGGTFSNETWEYTGPTAGVFGQFGVGCATVAGLPTIAGSVPTLGQMFTLTFDNLPLSAAAVLVALGLSNQVWSGLPLPFDLGLIGLPGCNLLVAADFLDLALSTGTTATYDLAIPNTASLLNTSLYAQGIVMEVVPSLAFLGTTRGGRAIVGN